MWFWWVLRILRLPGGFGPLKNWAMVTLGFVVLNTLGVANHSHAIGKEPEHHGTHQPSPSEGSGAGARPTQPSQGNGAAEIVSGGQL